jgi:hypothetical protein
MDILNFISWIRGGRIVKTVNPTQSVIPVATRDTTRDDGWLTNAMTVEDLANQIGGGSEYTETIVNITPTETTYSDGRPLVASGILAMGTTPIELLPAPGVGMYYDYYGFIEGSITACDLGGTNVLVGDLNNYGGTMIGIFSFQNMNNKVAKFGNDPVIVEAIGLGNSPSTQTYALNTPIVMTTNLNTNPVSVTGTLRVKIYHKTITFGA